MRWIKQGSSTHMASNAMNDCTMGGGRADILCPGTAYWTAICINTIVVPSCSEFTYNRIGYQGPCTPSVCVCAAFGFHCCQWYLTHLAMADIGKHQRKSSQTLVVQGH